MGGVVLVFVVVVAVILNRRRKLRNKTLADLGPDELRPVRNWKDAPVVPVNLDTTVTSESIKELFPSTTYSRRLATPHNICMRCGFALNADTT